MRTLYRIAFVFLVFFFFSEVKINAQEELDEKSVAICGIEVIGLKNLPQAELANLVVMDEESKIDIEATLQAWRDSGFFETVTKSEIDANGSFKVFVVENPPIKSVTFSFNDGIRKEPSDELSIKLSGIGEPLSLKRLEQLKSHISNLYALKNVSYSVEYTNDTMVIISFSFEAETSILFGIRGFLFYPFSLTLPDGSSSIATVFRPIDMGFSLGMETSPFLPFNHLEMLLDYSSATWPISSWTSNPNYQKISSSFLGAQQIINNLGIDLLMGLAIGFDYRFDLARIQKIAIGIITDISCKPSLDWSLELLNRVEYDFLTTAWNGSLVVQSKSTNTFLENALLSISGTILWNTDPSQPVMALDKAVLPFGFDLVLSRSYLQRSQPIFLNYPGSKEYLQSNCLYQFNLSWQSSDIGILPLIQTYIFGRAILGGNFTSAPRTVFDIGLGGRISGEGIAINIFECYARIDINETIRTGYPVISFGFGLTSG